MDFLTRALTQLKDLFQSMTPGARITAGLLLAVVVSSLGYLFLHGGYGSSAYLMNGEVFPAAQLSVMREAFGKAGLSGYEIDDSRVRIPRGQEPAFIAALAENNAMPPRFGTALDEALSVSGLWVDRQQREQLLQNAKQQELSRYICKLSPMIHSALVLLNEETKPGGLYKEIVKTAAVSVDTVNRQPLEADQVRAIRNMVAPAFGMKPSAVTVTDSSGATYAGNEAGEFPDDAADAPLLATKRAEEERLEQKILQALNSFVSGVRVTASVEIDPELHRREVTQNYDPKKTAPLQVSETSSSKTSQGSAPGGRPGYTAQQNTQMTLATTEPKGTSQEEEESQSETVNVVSTVQTESETAGLTIKRATAAIAVPASHLVRIWETLNPPQPGAEAKPPDSAQLQQIQTQETEKIQKHVAGLLPRSNPAVDPAADPTQLVTVTVFQDIPSAPIPEPALQDKALTWFGQSWSMLGVLGITLVSLVMLRSMTRATPGHGGPAGASLGPSSPSLPQSAARAEELGAAPKQTNRLRQFEGGERSLREELTDLVAEDPDTAANILRTWIGTNNFRTAEK